MKVKNDNHGVNGGDGDDAGVVRSYILLIGV
jgi:hypothetical protein